MRYHLQFRIPCRKDGAFGQSSANLWRLETGLAVLCRKSDVKLMAWALIDKEFRALFCLKKLDWQKLERGLIRLLDRHGETANGSVGLVDRQRLQHVLFEPVLIGDMVADTLRLPVEAGLVADPRDWPAASTRAMFGIIPAPVMLEIGMVMRWFGTTRYRGRTALEAKILACQNELVLTGIEPSVLVAGDEMAVVQFTRILEVVHIRQKRPNGLSPAVSLRERNRKIMEAAETGYYTRQQLADIFGMHHSSICRILSHFRKNATPIHQ